MNELYFRQLLEYLIILPCAFMAILPVRKHLRVPVVWIWAGIPLLLGGICAGASYISMLTEYSALVFFPTVTVCFLLYRSVVKIETGKALFCFLNSCMLGGYVTLYVNYLVAPLEDEAGLFTLQGGSICLLLTVLIIPVFYRTLSVKLAFLLDEDRLNADWRVISAIPAVLTAVFFWSVPRNMELVTQGRIRLVFLTTALLFPVAVILIYHVCWGATIHLTEAAQMEEEYNLLQMEQKRYEALRSYIDETRTLRHDFRQHLLVLSQLSADGKSEELDDYIKQLAKQTVREHPRYSPNAAVDAIAARYTELAAMQRVKIVWMLELGETVRIRETDLCVILGNLLENAIRAVRDEPEGSRWVNVYARMLSEAMLAISVENPCSRPVEMKGGLPVTKRQNHGLGLASVAATVHRYGGSMEISAEDGIFSVNILFCFR